MIYIAPISKEESGHVVNHLFYSFCATVQPVWNCLMRSTLIWLCCWPAGVSVLRLSLSFAYCWLRLCCAVSSDCVHRWRACHTHHTNHSRLGTRSCARWRSKDTQLVKRVVNSSSLHYRSGIVSVISEMLFVLPFQILL